MAADVVGGAGLDARFAAFDVEDAVRLDVEVAFAVFAVERDEGLSALYPQACRSVVLAVDARVHEEGDARAVLFETALEGAEAGVGVVVAVFPVQRDLRRIGLVDAVADVFVGGAGVAAAAYQRFEFRRGGAGGSGEEERGEGEEGFADFVYIRLSARGVCIWGYYVGAVAAQFFCCPHPNPPPRGREPFRGGFGISTRVSVYIRLSTQGVCKWAQYGGFHFSALR